MRYNELEIGDRFSYSGGVYLRKSNGAVQCEPLNEVSGDLIAFANGEEVELIAKRTSTRTKFDRLMIGEQFTLPARPGAVYTRTDIEVATNDESGSTRIMYAAEPVDTFVARAGLHLTTCKYPLPGEVAVALAHRDATHLNPLLEDLGRLATHPNPLIKLVVHESGDTKFEMTPPELLGLVKLVGELIEYVGELEYNESRSYDAALTALAAADEFLDLASESHEPLNDARRLLAERKGKRS